MALKKLPGGVVVETTNGARLNEDAGVNLEAIHRQLGAQATAAMDALKTKADVSALAAVRDTARAAQSTAQSAQSAASAAVSTAGAARTTATNAVDRVTALESAAGFGPSTPVDGQTASLIGQPETLTRAATDAAAYQQVGLWAGRVNVRDFGARAGSTFDSTPAFLAARDQAVRDGLVLYIPKGAYYIDPDVLTLPAGVKLWGAGESLSSIHSRRADQGVGVTIAQGVEVAGVQIRGFQEGIRNNGYWTKIHDCKLSYNTVGLHLATAAYICKVYENDITFNKGVGVLVGNEPYQTDIHHNIIDNNRGIGVAMYGATGGLVIRDNTIEGNRDYTSGFGMGIYMRSTNLSRTQITGNWFEANGAHADSVDVFFPGSDAAVDYQRIAGRAVNELIPEPYRANFTGTDGLPRSAGTGTCVVEGNGFIFTRHGLVASGDLRSVWAIRGNTFKGRKGTQNRHIVLNFRAPALGPGTTITIGGNGWNNTDDRSINDEVATGVGGSIVHAATPPVGASPDITLEGRPLFEKHMTLAELVAITGFRAEVPVGTFTKARRLNQTYDGYRHSGGSDKWRTGASDGELLPLAGRRIVVFCEPGASIRVQREGTWSLLRGSTVRGVLSILTVPADLTTGTPYANAGEVVYGYGVIPQDKEAVFRDITTIRVTDWDTEPAVS